MPQYTPDPIAAFEAERSAAITTYPGLTRWQALSNEWMQEAFKHRYMYNFSWLGRPIIQIPTDMAAIQEVIWAVKPDLIVETGIAHGGSLIFSASMMALLDLCEAVENGTSVDPLRSPRKVLGIDIDIRAHNRAAIEAHPLSYMIEMIQGSSLDGGVVAHASKIASGHNRVLVCLDSNHTHNHVLAELEAYAPLTSPGSYCIVLDSIVEDMPANVFPDRPWAPGNNPKTAIHAFHEILVREGRNAADGAPLHFARDDELENKLLLSVAPTGFLKRL